MQQSSIVNNGLRVLLCPIAAICALLASAVACRAQIEPMDYRYAVFELPSLGGDYSYGWTLDKFGNVVGSSYLAGNHSFHATLWIGGQHRVDLGTLGGDDSDCRGINSNGWIVGRARLPGQSGFDFGAYLWRNGEMMNLGNLGGDFAEAYGINDRNQIVGWSALDNSEYPPTHAFLWEDGQMTDLGTLDGSRGSEAIAINNSGLIVGQATSAFYTTWRPVIWQNGEIIDLGTFRSDNGGDGVAIDCNESSDVVGYTSRDFITNQAFLYHNGHMRQLPEKRHWTNSYAWSINDNRQIVGAGRTEQTGTQDIGCIWDWDHPGVEYLGELIPPKSNWFIGLAIHNNDAGQITGTGYRLNDPDHTKGYLLTPVHPSMELSEAVPGVAGEANTLTITGATPGARVVFVYGRRGGGAAIPGCTLQANCLQIENPKIIGHAFADADGVASITANVPLIAHGQGVLFQACVQDECAVSQLVAQKLE